MPSPDPVDDELRRTSSEPLMPPSPEPVREETGGGPRLLLHPRIKDLRGMCSDELPWTEIDAKLAELLEVARDVEFERDTLRLRIDARAASTSSSKEEGGDPAAGLPDDVRAALLNPEVMVAQDAEVFDLIGAPNQAGGLTFFVGGGPDPNCEQCAGTGELKVLPATIGAGPPTPNSIVACSCRWRSAKPLVETGGASETWWQRDGVRCAIARTVAEAWSEPGNAPDATHVAREVANAMRRVINALDGQRDPAMLGCSGPFAESVRMAAATAPPAGETGDGREFVLDFDPRSGWGIAQSATERDPSQAEVIRVREIPAEGGRDDG